MEKSFKLSTIKEVKEFMQKIEQLLQSFSFLKKNADKKMNVEKLLNELEIQFFELPEIIKTHHTFDKDINNFLISITDFTKTNIINNGSMLHRKNLDFFDLMKKGLTQNFFDYGCWGKMNTRLQQLYLRIYSYYGKCLYELLKK